MNLQQLLDIVTKGAAMPRSILLTISIDSEACSAPARIGSRLGSQSRLGGP